MRRLLNLKARKPSRRCTAVLRMTRPAIAAWMTQIGIAPSTRRVSVAIQAAVPDAETRVVANPWHHYANPYDVDGADGVTPLDVLIVINYINAHPGDTALPSPPASGPPYYDVSNGDGITALAKNPRFLKRRRYETVLTPHAGEMSRIAGKSREAIENDPIGILRETAAALDSIVVLKGAHSLVGYPDGRVWINMSGNSGMATAGSGDVLTGAIGAMFGLGLSVPEAVRAGVFVHGLAGDLAAAAKGEDGITARDIMESLPRAVVMVRAADLGEIAEKKGLYII